MNERMYLYLCEDLTPGPTAHQPDERLEPVVVAWDEAVADGPRRPDRGRQDDAGDPALRRAPAVARDRSHRSVAGEGVKVCAVEAEEAGDEDGVELADARGREVDGR